MRFLLLDLVVIFDIGVIHFLPKCALNGVVFIVFCFDILSRCIIALSEFSKLNFLFYCDFMQDNCSLIVCIRRSTNLIAL